VIPEAAENQSDGSSFMSRLVEPLPGHPYHRHQAEDDRRRLHAEASTAQRGKSPAPQSQPSRIGKSVFALSIGMLLVALIGAGYVLIRYDLIDLSRFGIRHSSLDKTVSPSATDSETVIFSGHANELTPASGNTIEEDNSAEPVVWMISSLRTAKPNGATDGVSVKIPSSLSDNLQARRIRVTISAARRDGADSSSPFAISYSTDGGNSGWRVFQPTNEFNDYSFTYAVPNIAGATHFVGIWSDIGGRSIPLAVRRITVSLLP
jgi:hypothetical protein